MTMIDDQFLKVTLLIISLENREKKIEIIYIDVDNIYIKLKTNKI